MEEKDKVTPEIYEEERSDRVVRLEVHRGGREEPEPMVPLRAVEQLLIWAAREIENRYCPSGTPLQRAYDTAAKEIGLVISEDLALTGEDPTGRRRWKALYSPIPWST